MTWRPFQALALVSKGRRTFSAAGRGCFAPTAPVFSVARNRKLARGRDPSRSMSRRQRGKSWIPTTPSHLGVVDRSVLIVMVVIGIAGVSVMIVPVIGHGVSDCSAPDTADDRADRTTNNSPGDGAPDPSRDRAAFVG
jgi:hypothetical protein